MGKLWNPNVREFLKEELGKILKIFIFLYVGMFLFVQGYSALGHINAWLAANSQQETPAAQVAAEKGRAILTNKPNSISIPKLGIAAPLILVPSTNPDDFLSPLKKGVVHYPSALPGEEGRMVVLGHSSPPGWPKINYDWVFSELQKLEAGDEIIISFDNRQYSYKVQDKIFLKQGEDLPLSLTEGKSELVLISCWPPGINNKRIVVSSVLEN